ncbi:TPA: prefoldin subunit beta [archaeon]|nr:prefoldin subunit beta [Candidatus Naiadarchaeales archaeon SRR2090159.bin1288]
MAEPQISEATQQKIRQFQELQQQARILSTQKFQFDAQKNEMKNSLEELEKAETTEVYKAIGQIIIKSEKPKLISEIKERLETLDLRMKAIEKQEKKTVDKLHELQGQLESELSGMRGSNQGGGAA